MAGNLLNFRLLVHHLVELPEAGKTLLAAEVSCGQTELDAGRALHGSLLNTIRRSAGLTCLGGEFLLLRLILLVARFIRLGTFYFLLFLLSRSCLR